MRLSEQQMYLLREAADDLHRRYPEITFHAAQAEEFDAQMTIISAVQPVDGRYIHEQSPVSEPADRAAFESAEEDARSRWHSITGYVSHAS